jgi:hypothetical protein
VAKRAAVAVFVVLVAGCGGDDDVAEPTEAPAASTVVATVADATTSPPATETVATSAPATAATAAAATSAEPNEEAPSGELPDPCTLVSDDVLAAALGSSPGAGELMAPVPDQRKVCFYPDGTILAVEVAGNWEGSLDVIRENLGDDALVPVAGLGEEAFWQPVGGDVGQLLAREGDVFVGVTLATGGQDAATAIAQVMLAGS